MSAEEVVAGVGAVEEGGNAQHGAEHVEVAATAGHAEG